MRPPTKEQLPAQRNAYLQIARSIKTPIVIVGAGEFGVALLERLATKAITPVCFCDNAPYKHNTQLCGYNVLPASAAAYMLKQDAVFVVAVYNGRYCREQLQGLGCKMVISAAALLRHLDLQFLSIESCRVVREQWQYVEQCAALWGDDKSRLEYNGLIDYFTLPDAHNETHDSIHDIYYPEGLWKNSSAENVVDCGAYNGDSVKFFVQKFGDRLGSLTAYEPDSNNFSMLQDTVEALPDWIQEKIWVKEAAVGERNGQICFTANSTVASAVDSGGEAEVACVALDNETDRIPTYIKMDLEGYEQEALRGAARLINEHAPILAITTYHRVEHLWKVPLLIHSLNPSYKLYLRRYAEDCWESVCYAVPAERVVR